MKPAKQIRGVTPDGQEYYHYMQKMRNAFEEGNKNLFILSAAHGALRRGIEAKTGGSREHSGRENRHSDPVGFACPDPA